MPSRLPTREIATVGELLQDGRPGSYAIEGGTIWLLVPAGASTELARLPFTYTRGEPPEAWHRTDGANGITLHPSIGVRKPGAAFLYHGWLRDGELIEA